MHRHGPYCGPQRSWPEALGLIRPNRSRLGVCAIVLAFASGAVLQANGPARGAGEQLFASALTPLLETAAGSSIGSVSPGTLLDAAEESEGQTHVTLHGWSSPKTAGVVYVAPDRPIVELRAFKGHASSGAAQTVGGTTYTAVTIDGWIATTALVPDIQPVWSNAAALYAQRCGTCHAVPDPASNSLGDWPEIVGTWAPSANLDPAQTALITAYLQAQSKN